MAGIHLKLWWMFVVLVTILTGEDWIVTLLNVGLLDRLLGVAGMMILLVMTGIIPESSLPSTSEIAAWWFGRFGCFPIFWEEEYE